MNSQSIVEFHFGGPPQLQLSAGTRFGHRAWKGLRREERTLIQVPQTVSLQAGLHLLVAPNGVGKTTLLRSLAGLAPVLAGKPSVMGCVHYVSDQLQLDGELTPRAVFRNWFEEASLLYALHLAEVLNLNIGCEIHKLSRGNKQKVLLIVAEVLAEHSGPSVLLLDEPMTGLDAETREIVSDLWVKSRRSILRLVVLHELESVKRADSLLTVVHGELRHTCERKGGTWWETCQYLRAS